MMQFIKNNLDDILALLGIGLIVIATYKISPITAMYVMGAVLLIGALLIGLRSSASQIHNQRKEHNTKITSEDH
ncbi:MAG: hypothetical protein JXL67_07430 [Calditrichaeota bacterium]|nr:hypothetical protein [Calditrichota bacterium]